MSMQALQDIWNKQSRIIVGLMSGTSVDGIDAAVVRLLQHAPDDIAVTLLAFDTMPFPEGLQNEVIQISTPENSRVDDICRMNFVLGEHFAKAAVRIVQKAGLDLSSVDLIGTHGQTIYHLPDRPEVFGVNTGATLQIGDPSVIAQRTGVVTVGDFRPADIARGGQGAPLVAYVDYLLFRSETVRTGLLNIGGISNITILPTADRPDHVVAFDTGPGNMVIDAAADVLTGKPMDQDGLLARNGVISQELLNGLLAHPYFGEPPPKSTGREVFGRSYADRLVREGHSLNLSTSDMLATATELTVSSVLDSYTRFIEPVKPLDELIISGGGARNGFLMERLSACFDPVRVVTSNDRGMPSDAKEAIAFAVLANQTITARPGNLPGATGADRMVVLGKICIP